MPLQSKSRLVIKSKNIKNISIPFLFIFTFLLVLFNKTDYFLVNKVKSTGLDVVNPVSRAISYPINITVQAVDFINDLRLVKKENIKLKEEIVRLKKWQTLALKNSRENIAYKKLLNSTSNEIDIIKTAKVIQQSPLLYTRSIIVNAGLDHQIKKNFAVINERGLVGKTILVTKNNSKVLLINDQNSSVPVRSANGNFLAVMKGDSKGKFLISTFYKR